MATADIPAQFIVVYYKNFVYNSIEVKKFYDENAKIWRQSMPQNEGMIISEAADQLVPEIPKGTDFHVLTYQTCSIENGYLLNVTASLTFEGKSKILNQSFVLAMKFERCFVVSDILTIKEVESVLPTNVETTAVKNTFNKLGRTKSGDKPQGGHPQQRKSKTENSKYTYRAPTQQNRK